MAKKGGYCVIGLGRFGYEVATQLNKMGKNVMVMDTNRDIIQKASKIFDVALVCDASDLNSLKETGIEGVNTVIVGISEIESNIMVCANLKELQIKEIIAKAKNSIHKRVLRTMGVSRIVIPEIEIGDRVAFQALFNIDVDIVNIGNGFS
jgi:trk system potassium uptake protein TrkA